LTAVFGAAVFFFHMALDFKSGASEDSSWREMPEFEGEHENRWI
jgi:hypothetical protein